MYAKENRNSNIYMRQCLEERYDFNPNNKTMSQLNFVLTYYNARTCVWHPKGP